MPEVIHYFGKIYETLELTCTFSAEFAYSNRRRDMQLQESKQQFPEDVAAIHARKFYTS